MAIFASLRPNTLKSEQSVLRSRSIFGLSVPSPRRFLADPYFRKSAIYFIGSMSVAFLNYLFHPLLAKRLSLADFGDVQALLSLATEMTAFLGAFTFAAVHASVNCEEPGECSAIIHFLQKMAFAFLVIAFVSCIVFAPLLATSLHFLNAAPFVALAALLVTTTYYSIRTGFLQGQGRFVAVSLGNLIVAAGRIAFALIFVVVGWHAFGAMIGIVCAQAFAFAYVFWQTRRHLGVTSQETRTKLSVERMKSELGYVALVGFTMAYITVLYTVDVLIVKHYFSADLAGMYSGMATIAKIIFFACGPLITVLVSSIKRNGERQMRRRAYFKAVSLVGVIGGGLVFVFTLLPNFIIAHMIGARYLPYAHLLPWLSLAFFGASLTNISTSFGLALRRARLLILAAFGTFTLIVLTVLHHANLDAIVQNMLFVAVGSALVQFLAIRSDL